MTTPFDTPLVGYRFVETQFGDQLQDVALRELGDASLWTTIVALNNLLPPYLTDDPDSASATVILNGSYIVIPAAAPVSATADPDAVFLTDMALDSSGLLTFGSGTFSTISGLDNLQQALNNALATDQGELLFHGAYGSLIRRLVGAVNGPTAGLVAAQDANNTVSADTRISSVTSAVATVSGDGISVVVDAVTVAGKSVTADTIL